MNKLERIRTREVLRNFLENTIENTFLLKFEVSREQRALEMITEACNRLLTAYVCLQPEDPKPSEVGDLGADLVR